MRQLMSTLGWKSLRCKTLLQESIESNVDEGGRGSKTRLIKQHCGSGAGLTPGLRLSSFRTTPITVCLLAPLNSDKGMVAMAAVVVVVAAVVVVVKVVVVVVVVVVAVAMVALVCRRCDSFL
ncbi:unnamed protein product [Boreogadus saida]